jgi:hypothetical protein
MTWQYKILYVLFALLYLDPVVSLDKDPTTAEFNRYADYQEALGLLKHTAEEMNQTRRLIHEMRRYRIRLLDSQRQAQASDDDLEAAIFQEEITNMDELILAAENTLAQSAPLVSNKPLALPGGLEKDLILYYMFDEANATQVFDVSNQGNHGEIRGAKWSKQGRHGGAYWFDGIDDHIQTSVSPSLDLDQELSLSVCVYRKSADKLNSMNLEYLISTGDRSHSDLTMFIAPGGGIGISLHPKNLKDDLLRIPPEPAKQHVLDNDWTHLVLTYDGQRVKLYVDGRKDKVKFMPGDLYASNGTLNIGRMGNVDWYYGFKGKLDDLIVWNRALTEVEVRGLWATFKEF